MKHPLSTIYYDHQVARVLAILPAIGAWDPAPLALPCAGFDNVTLYFTYTGGGQQAAAAFRFRIDASATFNSAAWYQMSLYGALPVVDHADTQSDIQRESIEYGITAADATERFVYGPIDLGGAVELIRVVAAETGVVGTPGTLGILARFGND